MPRFKYTAKGFSQESVSGFIEAENDRAAAGELQRRGLFPISVTLDIGEAPASTPAAAPSPGALRIKKTEFSDFVRQLYDMISSGVSLLRALEILQTQAHSGNLKELLNHLIVSIRSGQRFSDALKAFPAIFSNFFVSLVRSGEASGSLDQVLMRLADFAEAQEDLKSRVRSAMAYPLFVMSVGFLVVAVLLTFVVPKMSSIFEDLGQGLPILTKVLVETSLWLKAFWWIPLTALIFLLLLLRKAARTPESRKGMERILLRLPLFGDVHRGTQIARLARTLHMLISNGVPLVQAFEIGMDVVSDAVFRDEISDLCAGLSRGEKIRDRLKKSRYFPLHVASMIVVGEETGQLERSLKRIADAYERQVDRQVKLATSLMEPVMILVIGSIVGLIAVAMLLPIFEINFLIR